MDYEQKYKEALKVIESLYNVVRYQSSSDALLTFQTLEKAFPELKESEDERIRKVQLDYWRSVGGKEWYGVPVQETIAWLEKQGEHSNFRNKIQIGDRVTRNGDGVLVNLSQLNRVAKKDEKQGKQKPSWSEEDEQKLQDVIYWFEIFCAKNQTKPEMKESLDWLKSLKPNHWKPSEEEMEALLYTLGKGGTYNKEALNRLYDDLKKL